MPERREVGSSKLLWPMESEAAPFVTVSPRLRLGFASPRGRHAPESPPIRRSGIFKRLFDGQGRACERTRGPFGFIPAYAEVAWGNE